MRIDTIIELLFLVFFLIIIGFIVLGVVSLVEMADYFMGENPSPEVKIMVYVIISAIVLYILNFFYKKVFRMNKYI